MNLGRNLAFWLFFLSIISSFPVTSSATPNCVSFEVDELPMSGRKITWKNSCGGSATVTIQCSNGREGKVFVPSCGKSTSYMSTMCGDGKSGFRSSWTIKSGADLTCMNK